MGMDAIRNITRILFSNVIFFFESWYFFRVKSKWIVAAIIKSPAIIFTRPEMVGEKVTTFEKENNPIPDAIKKLKRSSAYLLLKKNNKTKVNPGIKNEIKNPSP